MSVQGEIEGVSLSMDGLRELAARVFAEMEHGAVVWLEGELGAGKTTFVQLLVEEAGGQSASSPSFSLVNDYPTGSGDVYHADCYRLRSEEEAVDLDLWGLSRIARLLLVEWPTRAGDNVPPPTLRIIFAHVGDPARRSVQVKRC